MDDSGNGLVPQHADSGTEATRGVLPRRRSSILLALTVLLVVGAQFWQHPQGNEAWNSHGGTSIRYRLELPPQGLPTGRTAADAVRVTAGRVSPRLHAEGFAQISVEPLDGLAMEVRVPTGTDADAVRRAVARIGLAGTSTIEFRIVVKASYPTGPGTLAVSRPRERVWEGASGGRPVETFDATPSGFDAFKEREVARFTDPKTGGEKYVPLDARYRVVPVDHGQMERPVSSPREFLVVEEPTDPKARMSRQIIESVRGRTFQGTSPSAIVSVKAEWQRAFHDWTEKNVGQQMATLLDGACVQAPEILTPLVDTVIVTPSASLPTELAERARLLELQWGVIRKLEAPLPAHPVEESSTVFGSDGKPSSTAPTGPR